jgi:transcriptional regulator with XRE-family HTH domain
LRFKLPKMADYVLSIGDSLTALGARARQLRLLRNRTQADLARDAGVGLKALRRFESTGSATTETALRLAVALGVAESFGSLFEAPPFKTLAEIEASTAVSSRRRARRRR